jgi:hypothetical protein
MYTVPKNGWKRGQARKDIKYRMLPVQQIGCFARRGAAKKSKKLGYY